MISDKFQHQGEEHFAIVRTRILAARAKSGIRSVLISSPEAYEGKSFTSLNLAVSLAQLQKEKILFVDADLRLRGSTRRLRLESEAGLSDFLEGRSSFQSAILPAPPLHHLFVCPAGQVPQSSLTAILEGNRWHEFLQTAKNEFGMVIVDSVPVTAPIADLELLSVACDAIVLVVRLRKTRRDALDIAVQRLNGKLLGVIVNNADPQARTDYYSYYGKGKRRQPVAIVA
jgi:capsular exopolysaccharide synthesis family protein